MIVKAAQWGNSIGVRIPRALAKEKGIDVDTAVEANETKDGVIIKPVGKKEYSLKSLLRALLRRIGTPR